MSKKVLCALLISVAAHVAVVMALNHQEARPRTIHMGSIQAPVALSFSTVSQPEPPVEEPVVDAVPEPQKPEVVEKPPEKAKPVLAKKPKPQKPEPVKEKPKKVAKKPKPAEPKKPAMERSVTEKSQSPGLSNEPVMVTEPAIRNWVEPRYPRMAQRRNQQGVVMLDVIVDEQGNPVTVDVLKSSGYPVLDDAAVDAVKRWSFQPEQRNQQFVRSRVHIPVVFEIS